MSEQTSNYSFLSNTIRKDGLVNATALTTAYRNATGIRKDVSRWLSTQEAKASIAYLEEATQFCVADLVIVENGVGTWLHPDLAEILAQWISVEYRFAVVSLIRRAKAEPIEDARENLEAQFGDKIKIKEIREMTDFFGDLFGTSYKQRFGLQQVKKHYPQLAGDPPLPQEWASLPSAKALINVTEIANQIGVFYSTGNPNPQPINAKLVELGYQTVFLDYKNRKKYSPTEKAIALNLCDRKPVETNSRTQQDQLLWSIDVVDILKEYFVAV